MGNGAWTKSCGRGRRQKPLTSVLCLTLSGPLHAVGGSNACSGGSNAHSEVSNVYSGSLMHAVGSLMHVMGALMHAVGL